MKRSFLLLLCLLASIAAQASTVRSFTTITGAEYFWDNDPGLGNATQIPISATPIADVSLNLNTGTLAQGTHTLGVRVRRGTGQWSPTQITTVFFPLIGIVGDPSSVTAVEYFWGADAGLGQNTVVPIPPTGSNVPISLSATVPPSLSANTQVLSVRTRDGRGQWSPTQLVPLVVLPPVSATTTITRIEVFANTDPGYGQAFSLPFSPTAAAVTDVNTTVNPASLTIATGQQHTLFFRARDSDNRWSALYPWTLAYGNNFCPPAGVAISDRSGSWTDALTWQCGDVPTAALRVVISTNHVVTMPQNVQGAAQGIETRGQLRYQPNARLRLGPN